MTYHPNPIPILRELFNIPLHHFLPRAVHIERMHELGDSARIPDDIHHYLFEIAMVQWGLAERQNHLLREDGSPAYPVQNRRLLWRCYFPDTRPHIYHLLNYVHFEDLSGDPTAIFNRDVRVKEGYSDRVIRRILHQPRLHRRQVDRVRRFAIQYIDELASPKRKRGPDQRYMTLHRALNDPKRQYAKGEIVTD